MKSLTLSYNKLKAAGLGLILATGLAVTPAISYADPGNGQGRGKGEIHNPHNANFKTRDKFRKGGKEVVILHNQGKFRDGWRHKHRYDREYGDHHRYVRNVIIHEPIYRDIYTHVYEVPQYYDDDPRLSIGLHTGHLDLYFEN